MGALYNSLKFAKRAKIDVFAKGLRLSLSGRNLLKTLYWRRRRRRYKGAIFIFNMYDFGGRKFKRRKLTRHARLLLEKQKLRAFYTFLTERQIKNYLARARSLYPANMSGRSLVFDVFFSYLESRLDVAVYRLHFSRTLLEARQLVSHKAVTVNGRIVNCGSYGLRSGDVVEVCRINNARIVRDLFDRSVVSDSGSRRFKVSRLVRRVLRKRQGKNISFKGNLLKYWKYACGFLNFTDADVTQVGVRGGFRCQYKVTYDGALICGRAKHLMGLAAWSPSIYLQNELYKFVDLLYSAGQLEGVSEAFARCSIGRFKFRSDWYLSKRFKRKGKFRRKRFFLYRRVKSLRYGGRQFMDMRIKPAVLFSKMYKARKHSGSRKHRRGMSHRAYKLLQNMVFNNRRGLRTIGSFPVLFPATKSYEVDYRVFAGVYVGSYAYQYVPFPGQISPYMFYQFYLKQGL